MAAVRENDRREPGEALFEFLHAEAVQIALGSASEDHARAKLERIGFRVGMSLAERYTKDLPRMTDHLEIMKFICKDFWGNLYHKHVDKLRTNHKGVFVLIDKHFLLLASISSTTQYHEQALLYLSLPNGLLKGALAALGLEANVATSSPAMPECTFEIKIIPAEAH